MKRLVPLLESSDLDDAQELLRSALSDGPRPGSRERTALALGVVFGSVVTSAAAAGAGNALGSGLGLGSAGAKVAGGALGVSQTSVAVVAAKWLAVGLASGGLVAGGTALVQPGEAERPGVRTSEQAAKLAARPGAAASPRREVAASTLSPAPESTASEVSLPARPVAAQGFGSALSPLAEPNQFRKTTGKLGREVELIDAARRAVAAGDSSLALKELERYERVRETGTLDREARLLRIDALLLHGDRRTASALARSYLDQFPTDAHASRLRELLLEPAKSTER